MTTAGHRPATPSIAAALLLAAVVAFWAPAHADTELPRYWKDPGTGIAIGGFDPVAYFVRGKPVRGDAHHEYRWGGVTWRFASASNRAVFMEAPEVYAPQFGGYSAVGLARGYPSRGNPTIWSIEGDRLYLFHSAAQKAVWQGGPQLWVEQAAANWPAISRTIPQ